MEKLTLEEIGLFLLLNRIFQGAQAHLDSITRQALVRRGYLYEDTSRLTVQGEGRLLELRIRFEQQSAMSDVAANDSDYLSLRRESPESNGSDR